jgi:hypothetical protein
LLSRLRTSGTDNSTSNYRFVTSTISTSATGSISTGQTSFSLTTPSAVATTYLIIDLLTPAQAENTKIFYNGLYQDSSFIRNIFGEFNGSTAFDSLSFLIGAGNISGSLQVWAFKG